MKTGIFIRIKNRNVDIIDAKPSELLEWLNTLTDTQKDRLIIKLLEILGDETPL